jgi:hypothetical protein
MALETVRKTYRHHKKLKVLPRNLHSAITNGTVVFANVDHRSAEMRRIKDLLAAYAVDLGGFASLSEGQRAILRRCVMLQVQCELIEKQWADNGGSATSKSLELYQRTSNSLRRQIEALNLHKGRVAKLVNDDDSSADVERLLSYFEPDGAATA